jgi:lycopene cyclase domain-containing protein
MTTYILLNVIFMTFVLVIMRHFLPHYTKLWFYKLAGLLLLTVIFDNILIMLNIVGYHNDKLLGVYLYKAPLEDFFYALLAVYIIPALWQHFGHHGTIKKDITKMFSTIKKLFWIARPISWPNTAYPFAAAYLVAGGQLDITFWLGVVYFLAPYNLLMYGVNDVFDYESDIKNPRKGGIEGMREQKSFHPTILRAAVITNLPFIIYFLTVGSWVSRLIFVLLIFFVLAYSVAFLRFKEKAVLDSITSSIHFVGPMIFGLSLTHFDITAWPYITAFFLWGMASHVFGAVQDIIPDRQGNLDSSATLFGARWTVRYAVMLYAVAAIIMFTQGFQGIFIGLAGLLYVINCSRYWNITDKDSSITNQAWRRFIWLNFITGFIVTMVLIRYFISM